MKTFDLIVIGAGAGARIYKSAAQTGLSVAIIEEGPFGGTCLNRGCIPSKMLIHSADVARTIQTAETFGISVPAYTVNFEKIMARVIAEVDGESEKSEAGARKNKHMTVYKERAYFIEPKVLQVGNETITAEKIFIAAGGRPSIPPIPGLAEVKYITSTEALRLPKQPKTLTIIGGGYIGAELGYFYGALGTKIQMIVRGKGLLEREDTEIAATFTQVFSKNYGVYLEHETLSVSQSGEVFTVTTKTPDGQMHTFESDQLLVATGRRSNADVLQCDKVGIALDARGNIQTNEFLETSVPGVYALGDIAGKYAFRHSANFEGDYLYDSLYGKLTGAKAPINYRAMPHAVFSYPQVAGVGQTEDELKAGNIPYLVAKRTYMQTAMGVALDERDGYIKLLVDPKTRLILGCHIIGHDASTLIHEIVPMIAFNHPIDEIIESIHVHPAMSELVQRCAWQLRESR